MEHEKLETLENKALLAAIYYLEHDEQSEVEKNFTSSKLKESISKSHIALYNMNNVLERGEMSESNEIDIAFLDDVRSNKKQNLITDHFFYSAVFYQDNEGDFVVIARETKNEFNANSKLLLEVLFLVSLVGMIVIFFSSLFLGRWAFKPLTNIINQIKNKNNQNFTEPIVTTDQYTEITDLVSAYNVFVNRIDQTFQVQKNFIDYVSHEIRTPITALLGTLEVTNTKDRTPIEYRETIHVLKQYVVELEHTIDNMMLLSGAKTTFEFKPIRIDEIIWEVVEQAILYHKATIEVAINVTNPDVLQINANAQLLHLAINNLVSNAIKYSNNDLVIIKLEENENTVSIFIIDHGIGIPENDLNKIMQNFYRGQNTQNFDGKGIGLSIAQVILKLHHIALTIKNNTPKGTCIELIIDKKSTQV
ncbi:HAMP domain-containing histidine kinase [Flavobacterium agricola]|uniref:histidine kinase n=2 Tax=Flavobacterium agricola TaxID=2870839 RepID=A0ABY6M4M0_9FLAO|nr:HAMP domain-containing histidine kinase [Flavobacterium agricola]